MPCPNFGLDDAACSGPSTAPSPDPRPVTRLGGGPGRTTALARICAVERSPQALRSWAAWPAARPSTAQPMPDSPASHRAWPRYDAARARSSTDCGPAARRSPERPAPPAFSTAISSRSGNDRYRPLSGTVINSACRHVGETTGFRPPATRPTASAAYSLVNPLAISHQN
jgi:hypothetical protein